MDKRVLIIQPKPTKHVIKTLKNNNYIIVLATNNFETLDYVDEYIRVDIFKEDSLLKKVMQYNEENPINCVLTTWEGTADKCALVAKILGLPGNEYQSILMSRDKLYTYYALAANSVEAPKTVVINDICKGEEVIEKQIGYPAIIKLRSSTNSQGVIRVNSKEEYESEINKLREILISTSEDNRLKNLYKQEFTIIAQEYLGGKEVNIDILYAGDKHLCMGIFEKEEMNGPYFPESMSIFPTTFTKEMEDEMIQLAWKGVKALGAEIGAAHIEIRYTPNGPKIIEIGLRPGGSYTALAIEHLYKVNIYEELVKLLMIPDYFPTREDTKSACIYAGILSKEKGTITDISDMQCLEEMPGMLDYVQIKQVGDEVSLPPKTSDPHIFHYILSGESRQDVLKKHETIKSRIKISIS